MNKGWGLLVVVLVLVLGILEFVPAPQFCTDDPDCYNLGPQYSCDHGICKVTGSRNGYRCFENANCLSGHCNEGIIGSKFCAASNKECGGSGSSGYDTGETYGSGICLGENNALACSEFSRCDRYHGKYCSISNTWVSGTGMAALCDDTDHCSSGTYYSSKHCNGYSGFYGACSVSAFVISADSSSDACACGGDTWMSSLGTIGGSTPSCCGDDGGGDMFFTYSDSLTNDDMLTCKSCNNGDYSTATLRGNGFFSGNAGGAGDSHTGTCYFGDMTCDDATMSHGASAELHGNGWYSGNLATSTSLTCYYGDIICNNGGSANGMYSTLRGNGYLAGSGTSRTCYYGDMTCAADNAQSGATNTIYGWGQYSGSIATSQTVECRSGAGVCVDGAATHDSISYLRGNGYVSGSTCYYGNQACSSGSESHGASCVLGVQDICGDNVNCFDCTTNGYNRISTSACRTSCTSNAHCSSGYFCDGGSCVDVNAKVFLIKAAGGSTCMRVEDDGDVIFAGSTLYEQGTLNPPANSFSIKNSAGSVVFYVDSSCNMRTKGVLWDNEGSLSFVDDNSFYIKNAAGAYVFKIENDGDIYAIGAEK